MFERFTPEGRHVIVYALEEVRAFGHTQVGSEHLLLGLARDPGVSELLKQFGVTYESAAGQIEDTVGRGYHVSTGQIPFTPESKNVLAAAIAEAEDLDQGSIVPGHILLGLEATQESRGARILCDCGAEPGELRRVTLDRLKGE